MRPLSHDIRVEIIPQLGVPGPKKVPATRCWSNYDMTVDSNLKRGQFCGVSNPFKDWRYQGRFDNDVLMSKGVLCANDHKVAWALGKRTIRIWSSLNCSQAPQSNQLKESEVCKEASHVFTCCVRRGYVSFEQFQSSLKRHIFTAGQLWIEEPAEKTWMLWRRLKPHSLDLIIWCPTNCK